MLISKKMLLVAISTLWVLAACSSSVVSKDPETINAPFDGEKFDNLEPFADKSFWKLMQWQISRIATAARWPKQVEQDLLELPPIDDDFR